MLVSAALVGARDGGNVAVVTSSHDVAIFDLLAAPLQARSCFFSSSFFSAPALTLPPFRSCAQLQYVLTVKTRLVDFINVKRNQRMDFVYRTLVVMSTYFDTVYP